MNEPVNRPASVWITQALLLPFLVNVIIVLPFGIFYCLAPEQIQSCLSPSSVGYFLGGFFAVAYICLTFWGLQKRKRYGKWLAVSLLVCVIVVMIADSHYIQLIYRSITQWQPLPTPPYECWEQELTNARKFCGYRNYRQLVLRIAVDVIPVLLLGILVMRLLYSRAAKLFFAND